MIDWLLKLETDIKVSISICYGLFLFIKKFKNLEALSFPWCYPVNSPFELSAWCSCSSLWHSELPSLKWVMFFFSIIYQVREHKTVITCICWLIFYYLFVCIILNGKVSLPAWVKFISWAIPFLSWSINDWGIIACSRLSVSGGLKTRAGDEWGLVRKRRDRRWSRSSPARFFDRPHWPRAWNMLGD